MDLSLRIHLHKFPFIFNIIHIIYRIKNYEKYIIGIAIPLLLMLFENHSKISILIRPDTKTLKRTQTKFNNTYVVQSSISVHLIQNGL